MASIAVCRPRCATLWALLAIAVVTARTGSAIEPEAGDPKGEIAERIRQAQSEGGPYSKELIDPLTTLSLLYLEEGQHALADAVIEQALQVMRANYGLRSLEQVPLMRQRILSEESRGNFAEAWKLELALQTMARAHPEDLRAAAVFHEIGDNRMEVLDRYRAGEFPPQLALGCYYDEPQLRSWGENDRPNCTSGSKLFAQQAMLNDAQRNYAGAIRVLLRQHRYADGELDELERKLIRSSYVYGRYVTGRQSLARIISYAVANGEPLLNRATALVQVADWDLLFEHRPLALDAYAQTYQFLEQQDVPQAAIDELFTPATPVTLPTFMPNPLAGAVYLPPGEYFDVAFEITRFGTSRRVEVLGSSDNASADARDEVVHLIERTRFRPRVTDGQLARASRVVIRYPLSE